MSTFFAANVRTAASGWSRLKQTIRTNAASFGDRICPIKVKVLTDPMGNRWPAAEWNRDFVLFSSTEGYHAGDATAKLMMDKLIRASLGDEADMMKHFGENRWTRERQIFDVGGARECVRKAIARIIDHHLGEYLNDADRTIIDVGAGEGWLPKAISPKWIEGGRYTPFDINPTFLARIAEKGLCSRTIEGSIYDLSRHVQNADAIIGCDSYDTFEELERAAEESYRALRKGGKLFIFQALRVDPSALYRMAKSMGIIYAAPIDAFFTSENALKVVMTAYILSKLEGKYGVPTDEMFMKYADLREQHALNANTDLFAPRVVKALKSAGFTIKVARGEIANVLTEKEERHVKMSTDHGMISLPDDANLALFENGIMHFENRPDIPPGKYLEQAEIIAVVAEKP